MCCILLSYPVRVAVSCIDFALRKVCNGAVWKIYIIYTGALLSYLEIDYLGFLHVKNVHYAHSNSNINYALQ